MRRWRGYQAVPADWGRSAVTIGVFDGVHKGHQRLIGYVVKRAADSGARSVVITFDPHPAEVLGTGSPPAILTPPDTKAELIEALGVDGLCVVPFTPEFALMTAEDFVRGVLVDTFHGSLVVTGRGFRFGSGATGDRELLGRLGTECGFRAEEADLLRDDEAVLSSTYVRQRVAAGDIAAANQALGRHHQVEGVVTPGDGRGHSIGFPTANLVTAPHTAVPADGVYAGWLVRNATRYPAAVSIGANPTFRGVDRRIEAHLLDFDGDLYGERVSLEFVMRLRQMRTYPTVERLVEQIAADVIRTRAVLLDGEG